MIYSRPLPRFGAYIIDGIFLYIAAMAFYPFSGAVLALGNWAPVPFWLLAFSYYFVSDSRWMNGQTIGKQVLKLKLVDARGAPPSFQVAALRAAVAAFLSASTALPASMVLEVIQSIVGLIGIGAFLVFIHPQRRTLLDLLSGTAVIPAATDPTPISMIPLNAQMLRSKMLAATLVVLMAIAFSGFLIYKKFATDISEMTGLSAKLHAETGQRFVFVKKTYWQINSAPQTITIDVGMRVPYDVLNDKDAREPLLQQTYAIVKRETATAPVNNIRVQFISYKYIGLWPMAVNQTNGTSVP